MITSKKSLVNKISKVLYLLGISLLLNGILLSSINLPVLANNSLNTIDEDKKIKVCHWTEANKYVSIEVSINSVASAGDWSSNGHGNHANDIYPAFIAKNGDYINEKGDQGILANDCNLPTPTKTKTATASATTTKTPTRTSTSTLTNTLTNTPSNTPTNTLTPTVTATVTKTEVDRKIQVCHWTDAGKYVSIEVSINSVASLGDWTFNGHGIHENDVWPDFTAANGDIIESYGNQSLLTNNCMEETSTPTVTATSSTTLELTPTFTATVTQSSTPTPTGTLVEGLRLLPGYACYFEYMEWSVTNPNTFSVLVNWELDPSTVGSVGIVNGKLLSSRSSIGTSSLASGSVLINPGETVVVTSSTPATHVFIISYLLGEGQQLIVDQLTNSNDFCLTEETPDIERTATPVPTLYKPISQSGQEIIPVTGLDLTIGQSTGSKTIGSLLAVIGLMMIGFAMVFQAIFRK